MHNYFSQVSIDTHFKLYNNGGRIDCIFWNWFYKNILGIHQFHKIIFNSIKNMQTHKRLCKIISFVRFHVLKNFKYTDGQSTHDLWEVLLPNASVHAVLVCQNGVKSVRTAWPVLTEFLPELKMARQSL